MKKIGFILGIVLFIALFVPKAHASKVWINDLKGLYQANSAIIYGINIRTFSAVDKNGNGIIEENLGEKRGDFLSAIAQLDNLTQMGINTVNLLPVFPVGKVKAIGTGGSLFAPTSFTTINPQLKSKNSTLSAEDQMAKFVQACHDRNLRVIVDIPSCGAYDLYLKNSSLFELDDNKNPITVSDWTDVKKFDAGTENNINGEVFSMYKKSLQMLINLGVDGVKINNPTLFPANFWKKLIAQTQKLDPQFIFIAEKANEKINDVTTEDKLLDIGFNGFYGDFNNISEWKTSSDVHHSIASLTATTQKHKQAKALSNFATHNQLSPILVNGERFSKMIMWLETTLPINAYYLDGFETGDTYMYPLANKKAQKSETDDEYYFVHRGQMDIFNYSRKPVGDKKDLKEEFTLSNKVKRFIAPLNIDNNITILNTHNDSVFAYTRDFKTLKVLVIGNLDYNMEQDAKITLPKFNKNTDIIPIKFDSIPTVKRNSLETTLNAGEILVFILNINNSK